MAGTHAACLEPLCVQCPPPPPPPSCEQGQILPSLCALGNVIPLLGCTENARTGIVGWSCQLLGERRHQQFISLEQLKHLGDALVPADTQINAAGVRHHWPVGR